MEKQQLLINDKDQYYCPECSNKIFLEYPPDLKKCTFCGARFRLKKKEWIRIEDFTAQKIH